MHAIVQREFGGPDVLLYEELPDLAPQAGQVRIAVGASGVHLLDTSIRNGTSFGTMPRPKLPMVPGREVAGVVDRLGPGVDAQWLGKRVVVHLGMASGGYAEQALAAVDSLHELNAGLGFDAAVAAIGTGRTATGILDQLALGAEDTVLIPSAAGGLGILLVQAARNAGATVIGLAGGPAKAAHALKAGAGVVIDYRVRGWQQQLRKLGRPTVVYDGVGGDVGRLAFELLADGGTQLVFGWSSGEENTYRHEGKTAVTVLGPALTARAGGLRSLEAEALERAADGTRIPLTDTRFPLSRAAEAHRALQARESFGKVVLVADGTHA
ncbi:zinc-binding dehydrogenase [Arthrobacter sulfonylureivorans]|uniref:zinc-binding dehydrogenase n=1 Tax=Arthrobacter sulfonylureivorans TaxID=2486855 RepID=UPI0039E40528